MTCLGQLGAVFLRGVAKDRHPSAAGSMAPYHIDQAIKLYTRAPQMLPEDAHLDLGIVHHQLGSAYRYSRDELDQALYHFRQACKQFSIVGRTADGAGSRANAALVLAMMRRPGEAMAAAVEALTEFRSVDHSGTNR
jgi:TPR repeat protein